MRVTFWLLTGALIAGSVHAAPYYGSATTAQTAGATQTPRAVDNPAVMLRAGIDRLRAYLGQDPRPPQERLVGFLNAEIAPFFDFEYMARTAGGHMFERLDEARQSEIVAQIQQSFLGKMAEKLGSFDNQQVRFLPPRRGNDGRTAQVSVAIMNPGTYPARLDFRLYRNGANWRVYDVAANGQSAIVHYRQQLTQQLRMQQMLRMQRMQQMQQRTVPMPPRVPVTPAMGYGPRPR
jgi:phospholipid transport system substrate-binding protein